MSDALQKICDYFELGKLQKSSDMLGGRSHDVKQLKTDKGQFIVKRLLEHREQSLNLDLLRNTATISFVIEKNKLPVVTPFIKNNDVIFMYQDNVYMVYPFIDASIIYRKNMSVLHCECIAMFLAHLHNLNLSVPAAPAWNYQYQGDRWKQAYDYFLEKHLFSIAPLLERLHKLIRNCFSKYIELKSEMVSDIVISHRDMDPYNVLWFASGDYAVIDWDLAGKIDAGEELMYAAMGFARDEDKQFNFDKFIALIKRYNELRSIKTKDAKPLFYAVLANWLTWCQGQLQKSMHKQYDLATLNNIVAGVRRSLMTTEYMLSIESDVVSAWNDALSR